MAQKQSRSDRRPTPGRPGERSLRLVERSDFRLPVGIATSIREALRRPVETAQFTAFTWTDRLRRAGVSISMDGKGRFLDNIFIERLWRSLKYECVYLHAWETGSQVRAGLRTWFDFYNHRRPHAALDGRPPDMVYRTGTTIMQTDQETRRVA